MSSVWTKGNASLQHIDWDSLKAAKIWTKLVIELWTLVRDNIFGYPKAVVCQLAKTEPQQFTLLLETWEIESNAQFWKDNPPPWEQLCVP